MNSDELLEEFSYLTSKWVDETIHLSSMTEIFNNYHYQKIIDLGQDVLPLIFRDLKNNSNFPKFWWRALRILTGHKLSLPKEDHGKQKLLAKKWLEWGEQNGYC